MRKNYEEGAARVGRNCRCCEREDGFSRALAILEKRYAKGEIEREEYMQKKQDLRARS